MRYIVLLSGILIFIKSVFSVTLYEDERMILIGDSTLVPFKNTINEHVHMIYQIPKLCQMAVDDTLKINESNIPVSKCIVKVRMNLGVIEYSSLPFGEADIRLNNHISMFNCYAYRNKICKPNEKELKEYNEYHKIPKSFKRYSQNEAIKIASFFTDTLIKKAGVKTNVSDFDSIIVSETEWMYNVTMRCKWKNDILDSRFIEILFCPNTGFIKRFEGNIESRYNLQYKPSITKSQVIAIFQKHLTENNCSASIYSTYLSISNRSKQKWGWNIFAKPESGPNYWIIIDSETGEIIQDLR